MASRPSDKPSDKAPKPAKPPSVISNAIDGSFRADASVREALTENLKPRRAESEAITARLHKAFEHFTPSKLAADGQGRRHYVAPGTNPGRALDTVIADRVKELRASDNSRGLTLRDGPELRSLIKAAPEGDDSIRGVVDLGELIGFINRKSATVSFTAESDHTPFTAEIEAEKMLAIAENAQSGAGNGAPRLAASALEAREDDRLVVDSVNVQMGSVTAPESQLVYGKIPNSAGDDDVQRNILQTFELRPGASDVTAYHDFHTLRIAFQHVWTRIFDGQLTALGRDLYGEYVKLKDFSGSTAPDFEVGTLADLRRLIDEVKKLSEFVDEDVPASLRPAGSEPKNNSLPTPTPEDVARGGAAVATLGVSLFIEWAFNELVKLGNNPVRVTWSSFPLKFKESTNNIIEMLPPEQNAYTGTVEIVLETAVDSFKKAITFQQWDPDTGRQIYVHDLANFGNGHGPIDRLVLTTAQVQTGTLTFRSEDEVANNLVLGRYVLGDLGAKLTERTRITFRWKGVR